MYCPQIPHDIIKAGDLKENSYLELPDCGFSFSRYKKRGNNKLAKDLRARKKNQGLNG